MPLVFAGVVPHPAILIPSIGKENSQALDASRTALERLEKELYLTRPQRIIIITPHEGLFENAFSVNAHTDLHSHFETFGDMTTKYMWQGAPELAAKIQQETKKNTIPTRLVSNEYLGHGASIPLTFLTTNVKEVKILPIGYCNLNANAHITFGHAIKNVLMNSDLRIAIIASGDMAHTLSESAPAGFHTDGKWFDSEIIKFLERERMHGIETLDTNRIKNADECLYRSLLILHGILGNMKYEFEQYAYEAPFGVGYLTGQFHL